MKSLSSKTYQCGVTIQGLTTLSGTVYLTGITNTASWDHVIVGTTAQGQIYTRTYAQLMSDITSGIGLSGYVPTSRTLTINGVSYDLTANRSWTITTPYVSKLQHQVKAGVAINKGQAVYVTSADGTNMIVGLASNASEATSSKTMGLLDATVSTNGFANVVTEGLLDGLDTSTAGAAGDPVWLGTGGNLIYGLGSKPYAPAHLVFIGIVTRKNSNNGEIFVKVQNGFELNEIHDVDLKTNLPVNGELLGFNGTLWVNKTIAGWLGYTPANASGTTNYISKFTGSTTLGNSLVFDNGTNVGIGTVTPDSRLHIEGNTTGSGSGADAIVHIKQNGGWNGNEPWALYVEGYSYLNGFRVNAYDTQRGLYSDAGELGFAVGGNSPISFTQNTSDYRMYIAPGGNIGIGTITPGYKLEVNGTGYFADNLKVQTGIISFDGVSAYWGNAIKYETGQLNLYQSGDLHLGVGGNNITLYKNTKIPHNQRFTAGGYSDTDGITIWGTQNASAGGDGFIGRNLYYNGTNYIYASTNDNNLWGTIAGMRVVGSGSNALEFIARPATNSGLNVIASDLDSYKRMVISYSGNVGIGTTAPASILDASVSNGATSGLRFKGYSDAGTPYLLSLGTQSYQDHFQIKSVNGLVTMGIVGATGANPDLAFQTNTTERMRITTGGNVGIGTTTPYEKLEVNGAISATGAVNGTSAQGHSTTLAVQSGISFLYAVDWGAEFKPLSVQAKTISLETGTGSTTSRLFIDNLGNVGIGTSSPSEKLDVYGAIKLSGQVANVVTNGIAHHTNGYVYFTGGTAGAAMGNDNYSSAIYAVDNGSLELYAGSANRLHITSGGNVGIGTTSPSQKLSLGTPLGITSGATVYGSNDQASIMWSYEYTGIYPRHLDIIAAGSPDGTNGGSNIRFFTNSVTSGANSVERMRITAGGYVGIGTTSPSRALNIVSNNAQIRISDNTAPTTNYWEFSSVFFNTNQDLFISNQSGTAITLNASLNVGIGTTSPSYKLDVNGSFNAVTSGVYLTYNSGIIYHGSSYYQFPSGSYYYLYGRTGMGLIFGSNNAEVGRFDLSGNLGIGTTSPGYKLEVNGIIKSGIAGNSSANYAALVVASAGTTTSQAAIAIQQLTSEGDTIIFGDYEPYVEYNFMHENASNVFHIHSGENTNSLGSNTFYNRSGNPRTGYIKWSLYQGNGDMHVGGSVGIGNTSPSTKLDVSGVITATGGNSTNWNTAYGWGNHASASYVPQARTLTINGTSYDLSANRSWTIATTTPGGSDTQVQYNSSGSLAGASALTYNSTTNRVGINQASPGYDLDVNGQVRVQDKLRIGTGNGVVHMSSTATINPSATTVVWAQTVSVGMCAFIEYYILNNNSLTDQRAGTIMVTWNQSGTPTIAHTETTTPDIGSTTSVNFTSSLVGSDARINAVNSSANPYTIVMSYKYF
jgi:hypothetical protein